LPVWFENAYSRPQNWSFGGISPPEYFWGVFHPKMERNISETSKGTSVGRNGSSGVLVMSVSSIVPDKSHGNKKCDEEEL